MKAILRVALPIAFAAWLALPGVGSDGGDNAGGTGVWILPQATFLASDSPCITNATAARRSLSIPNADSPVVLTAAAELGPFVATLIDPVSGDAMALPVNGRSIVLDASLLRSLRDSAAVASIVVADSAQLGYVMRVSFDPATGVGSVKIY